jgi:predicted nuclease of predicted toxin-antitoxin system
MKLLVDMNLSPRCVRHLELAGYGATHWSNLDVHNAPDEELMQLVQDNDHIVLTQDLDFGTILAAQRLVHRSVIQIRSDDLSIEAIGPMIVDVLTKLETDLASGALVTIEPQRTRVRVLPLR